MAQQASQQGAQIMRTTMGELEDAVRRTEADERSSILLPDISEGTFRDMLRGRHDAAHWKDIFPEECHEFVDYVFDNPISLGRISEDDAAHFFAKLDKAPLTDAEIRAKIPLEYHDLINVARPQEADHLPPHRSYDHKIELLPGAPLPYSRNRPMSPT